MKINIKPLSINSAYRETAKYVKRVKTREYKEYEEALMYMLQRHDVDLEDQLRLDMEVGFSNRSSDLSNSIKCFEDCLAKKNGFNDKQIYELHLKKVIVPKGEEYIDYNLEKCDGYDYYKYVKMLKEMLVVAKLGDTITLGGKFEFTLTKIII